MTSMIFHLMSAGVPTSWTIVAIYKNSRGVAINAAKSWQEREAANRAKDAERGSHYAALADAPVTPHYIIDLAEDGKIRDQDLLMDERFRQDQSHDERNWLIQFGSAPIDLDDPTKEALTAALHTALVDFGYLIPRSEWERRYPARHLIQQHYNAFSAAHKKHRDENGDAAMPFELRFAPYMESPEDFIFPYRTTFVSSASGGRWAVTQDDGIIHELEPADEEQAETMMRLLNSGYRLEDIPVLLANQPVE
jgi:hypothetical protein